MGGGGGSAFIFQPDGLTCTIRPISIAENMTTKPSMTGFGLKRPGDGVAASFYRGILVDFFGRGVHTQSDVVACNDIPSACRRL